MDSIRSAIASEYEISLRAERSKMELQLEQLKREHTEAVEALRSRDRVRETAEKQVAFNEALKRALEERDVELEQLRLQLEEERLNNNNASVAPVSSSSGGLAASVCEVDEAVDVDRLKRENRQLKEKLTMNDTTDVCRVSVDGPLEKGNYVMVVWAEENSNFLIYRDDPSLSSISFLHSDSLERIGLCIGDDGVPNKRYATAEVVSKEYCQARKPENRFKVPQGTRFYRVRCKAIEKK